MPEEVFLAALSSDSEKTEDTENGTEIYTFYADETKESYTEITVDQALHLVRGIKVVKQ